MFFHDRLNFRAYLTFELDEAGHPMYVQDTYVPGINIKPKILQECDPGDVIGRLEPERDPRRLIEFPPKIYILSFFQLRTQQLTTVKSIHSSSSNSASFYYF